MKRKVKGIILDAMKKQLSNTGKSIITEPHELHAEYETLWS
jgi:hypothetical protein